MARQAFLSEMRSRMHVFDDLEMCVVLLLTNFTRFWNTLTENLGIQAAPSGLPSVPFYTFFNPEQKYIALLCCDVSCHVN